MMHDYQDLEFLVLTWAKEKGILDKGDPKTQALKTVSEVGELADAIIEDDLEEIIDALGDVLVTLIILAELLDLDLSECLNSAYEVIKDRKGKMINGTFVKEI
jgi:NTP pyrophosphatase (non-canonical NTP hydrolase)